MTALPLSLSRLLEPTAGDQEDQSWADFVAAYSDVLVRTCRMIARDHDAAMDAYAQVLAALREDDCRRLRAYTPRPGTQFTTWLAVVARRLMLDYYRHRTGRPRSIDAARRAEHATRRRLEDLVAVELDPDSLTTATDMSPEAQIRLTERREALRESLEALDAQDRLLLALRFEDERSIRDIAAMLRLPTVFHVYRRVNAVLATLRESLARRGVTDPEP